MSTRTIDARDVKVNGTHRSLVIVGNDDGVKRACVSDGRALRPAPLRLLAKLYDADSSVWTWLRSHGIWRPSPSGRTSSALGLVQVNIALPKVAADRLVSLAASTGMTRSGIVAAALAVWKP